MTNSQLCGWASGPCGSQKIHSSRGGKRLFDRSRKKILRSTSQSHHSLAVDVPENGRHMSRNVPSRPLGAGGAPKIADSAREEKLPRLSRKECTGRVFYLMGALRGGRPFAKPNFTAAPKDPAVRRPWAGQTRTPRSLAIDSLRCPKAGSWCGSQRGPLLR